MPRQIPAPFLPIFLVIAGFMALFLPLYGELAGHAWTRTENDHAPYILAIITASFAMRLAHLYGQSWFKTPRPRRLAENIIGGGLFIFGLTLYLLGRFAEMEIILTASQLPVLAGALMLVGGWPLVRQLWFPLLMLIYLIVWPGWLLDLLTAPLKMWVSETATNFLASLSFPVAHSGVVIAAGPYQLLIADACSGLNSLIAMTAVGAVYLYLVKRAGLVRNLFLFFVLIPIAVLANIIRVILLIWITLQFGYDAGQGFLHELAGLVMFAFALSSLFLLDTLTEPSLWRHMKNFLFALRPRPHEVSE